MLEGMRERIYSRKMLEERREGIQKNVRRKERNVSEKC